MPGQVPCSNRSIEASHQAPSGPLATSCHLGCCSSSETSPCIPRSSRPKAAAFEPTFTNEEQYESTTRCDHVGNADWFQDADSLTFESTGKLPFILDPETMQVTGQRMAIHMPATRKAANQYRQQRLDQYTAGHYIDRDLHSQYEVEMPAQASSSQNPPVPEFQVPAVSFQGREYGLFPSLQAIEDWNQGPYIPTATRFPASNAVPPLSSGSISRPMTISIADSNGSFCCSSESCPKGFESKSDLDHHERYHGARQHSCSTCEKAFIFPKDLRRHEKIHEEERQFICVDAGCPYYTKGFRRKDHLKRHMQKVHGEAESVS